jgi:hypothetical protein
MQQKFDQMSKTVVDRLDDMGKRIDELEKSVGDLINEPVEEPIPESSNKKTTHFPLQEENEEDQ